MSETAPRSVMDVLLMRDLWFITEEDVSRINSYIAQGAFSPYVVLALPPRWRSVYWLLWLTYYLPSAAEGLINRYDKYVKGAKYALLHGESMRSVKITKGDELFFPALYWLSNHKDLKDEPDVVLKTKYKGSKSEINYDFVLDKGTYTFTENGVIYVAEYSAVKHDKESIDTITLSYYLRDEPSFGSLLNDFNKKWLAQSSINTMVIQAEIRYNGYEASWGEPHEEVSRNLKSVILNKAKKDGLISKLDKFLQPDTQKKYHTIKSPYHFGLLLYGRMGTGKSSLAHALAAHYRMRIYCLSLTEPDLRPSTLHDLLELISPNSILLLEEIDQIMTAAPVSEVRASTPVTVEGVLTALDKRAKQGGITIMTTNKRSKLDPRLIRPGRINEQIRFTYASKHQIYGMFMLYCWQTDTKAHSKEEVHHMALNFKDAVPSHNFTTADIHNFLVMYMAEPQTALTDVNNLIDNIPTIDRDADREADGNDCLAIEGDDDDDDDERNLPFEFNAFEDEELEAAHPGVVALVKKPEDSLLATSALIPRVLQASKAIGKASSDPSECIEFNSHRSNLYRLNFTENQAAWYLIG